MKKFLIAAAAVFALSGSSADAASIDQPVVIQADIDQSVVDLDMWSHLKHKIFGGKRKDDDDKHYRQPPPPPPSHDRHRYDDRRSSNDRNHRPTPPPPPPRHQSPPHR